MSRTLALLLLMGMILSGAIASELAQDFPRGYSNPVIANPALNISRSNYEFTSISLSSPQVEIDEVVVDLETYHSLSIPDESIYYREGCPAVPQITRFYRIPNTGSVDLVIREASYSLVDDINSLPIQPEADRFRQVPVKAADVYEVDSWYPAEIAVAGDPMIMRDYRVVPVTLFPVQVNTLTGQARIYDQLDVDLVANDTPGENEIIISRPVSGAFAPAYSRFIANLDETSLDDDANYTPGQYLILCPDNSTILQWVDTLSTWKRRRGFEIEIDARDNWTYSTMKSRVQQAYNAEDSNLEFVCIVGDPMQGTYYMPTSTTNWDGQYDHYFGTLAGSDEIADIAVGRLSVTSASQLATVMRKIMLYEREPYMDDTGWFNRAFLYAGTDYEVSSNEIMMLWARRQFERMTGVNDITIATHPGSVNQTLIGNQLNAGVCFFLWRGTMINEMPNSAASQASNGARLPVVLTITCGTGNFESGTSLSEAWLCEGTSSTPRGGVCGIATATSFTHVQYNNTVAGGLAYNICNLGVEHLGVALAGAKAELFRAFPNDYGASQFSRWNNLMGDPSLSMWTDEPVVMDCSFPGTISTGARRVTVQAVDDETEMPISGALVVLWKGEETYVRDFTDEGGFIDVPITVDTPGALYLTVTKRNHKPFLATITVANSAINTTYFSHTVDDDNSGGTLGNNDDNINPGEIVDLAVALKNHGTSTTAENISVTMQSDNPKVTVVTGTVNFASIPPGQTVAGSSPFRISVSSSMKHEETAKLSLAVTSSSGTVYSTVEIVCQAGDAVVQSYQITGGDGDNLLEPDEQVNLRVVVRNEGGLDMTNVTGHLISRHNFYSVIDADADFSDILIDGAGSNAASLFQIGAHPIAYPGTLADVLLVLTYGNGIVDSVAFSQPIGTASSTDPTGPDAYGYYAYDDIDLDYDGLPFDWIYEYDFLDILSSGLGTRLNLASSDPGEQMPSQDTFSNLVTLPFSFTFYGQEYSSITVCSNGWAAFGDQSELDMFRNYQIPAQQTPDACLCPFWDDLRTSGTNRGVYYYNDTANDRFIIQWTATGAFASQTLRFQILLLNPAVYPTVDGNGIVVFQYNTVTPMIGQENDVDYETIGIQAPGGLVGLLYRFSNNGQPGAAPIANLQRTITITTMSNVAIGHLQGTVLDAANSNTMEGVEISIDGQGVVAETDASGYFAVADIITGTYTVRARKLGYNDGVLENFVIEQDSTEIADFNMLHPEIELSTDHIEVDLPGDPFEASFSIDNDGNGPLDYQISVAYSLEGTETADWQTITEYDLFQPTDHIQIHGCELLNDVWYASATRNTISGQNHIFKFNRDGDYIGTFDQPWTASDFGFQDLATDGIYVYGSGGPDIVGFDAEGVVRRTITGATHVSPKSSIAYDPAADHFWIADFSEDIYELDRNGTILHQFQAPDYIRGLSWFPDDPYGYKLYITHLETATSGAQVSRMHPVTGDFDFVRSLETEAGERAAGSTITGDWNSALYVYAGVMRTTTGAYLDIRQLDFRDDWFSISPMMASVNPSSSRDVTIFFENNVDRLRDGSYDLNIYLHNNSLQSSVLLPVHLSTTLDIPEGPVTEPLEYALAQNYPNPFNSSTSFDFELKQPGLTKLTIYNLLGQEVALVMNDFKSAGRHHVTFDMNNTASGVYLYRLESGDFNQTRKMILLK
ncbi:carboxypeptidase regulatory-like domain-containing protein [bacterium]|nr:carboxypeptidase regulatory-like domain-containing protein [bacterium]